MKNWHLGHSRTSKRGQIWRLGLALALALGLGGAMSSGCAKKERPAAGDYSGQAKFAYEEAMEAFKSSDYLEALKKFNFVRTKFPYSKFAALASLRIADTYFEQDQWADAVSAYRRFIQLHPTHPELPYAQYRIGLAFYEQLPSDWFFLPPAFERDLASTEDAERECRRFLEQYPNSQYAEEIAEKLRTVRQRLADHEFYVATFYLKRNRPRAAAMRLSSMLERFPGLGFDEEVLFLLGKSYVKLSDVAKAVETWQQLIEQFPSHPLSAEAQAYIRRHNLAVALRTPAPAAPRRGSGARTDEATPEAPAEEVEDDDLELELDDDLQLEEPTLAPEIEGGDEEGGSSDEGEQE